MHEFIDLKCQRAGININLASFSIAGNNSNKNIYEFLLNNPTLGEVKEHFIKIFDNWKKMYNGTLFENYVDKDIALSYYYDSNKRLNDFYGPGTLTITSFNGCTGKFLENPNKYFFEIIKNNWNFLLNGLYYLNMIITMILNKSDNSYITVGNFPNFTHSWLPFHKIISRINGQIELTT